ncbi:hypothetical protein [Microbulbifer halophilus]
MSRSSLFRHSFPTVSGTTAPSGSGKRQLISSGDHWCCWGASIL